MLTRSVKRRSTPLVLRSWDTSLAGTFLTTPIRALGKKKEMATKYFTPIKTGRNQVATSQQVLSFTECNSQLRHKVPRQHQAFRAVAYQARLKFIYATTPQTPAELECWFPSSANITTSGDTYHHHRENSRSSVFVQNPVLCRIRSANSCDGYLFLPSWEELVWTAACSLDQSAEPEAAARSDTLTPSTPRLSQCSAAA